MKIKKIIVLLFLLALPVSLVHAQPSTKTQLETPTGPGTSAEQPLVTCGGTDKSGAQQNDCTTEDFFKLIQSVAELVFKLAGFIVAGMFMYAGFLLITSVGDPGKINKAKTIFRRTVIGLIIMFLSYLLVKNLVTRLFELKGNESGASEVQKFLLNLFN